MNESKSMGIAVQVFAVIMLLLSILGSLIGGFFMLSIDKVIGVIIIVAGIIASGVSFIFLYSFGELVTNVSYIRGALTDVERDISVIKHKQKKESNLQLTTSRNLTANSEIQVCQQCKACNSGLMKYTMPTGKTLLLCESCAKKTSKT